MDIAERRKKNLIDLIASRFEGNRSAAARAVGVTPGAIRQLCSGGRAMGEKGARKLEKSLGLPGFWLDTDHASPDPLSDIAEQVRSASPEVLAAIRLLLRK